MTRYAVQAGWDEAPHLSEEAKSDLANAYPAYQRDARMRGLPQLGAGVIYPVPESDIVVAPFTIPKFWKLSYGLDVGWNRTAAIWGTIDPDNDVAYLISEHYRGQAEPAVHSQAIQARGKWIPGVIDPAARGRSQVDGRRLLSMYVDLGLILSDADNAVESGIYETFTRLSTGRLKVFETLANWRAEYRLYRRDEKGNIVKENDHAMDATRYWIMSGIAAAAFRPVDEPAKQSAQGDYDPVAAYRGAQQ